VVQQGDFVAVDLPARLGVSGLLLAVRRAQLLIAGSHLDGHLPGQSRLAASEQLADLPHRGELLGLARLLEPVFLADAAASLAGRLQVGVAPAGFARGAPSLLGGRRL